MPVTTPKKILFISYDGMTDPLGQSQVIPYLQGLSNYGYSIFLLSCEKKEARLHNEEAIKKILLNAGIKWVPLTYTKKPPVFSTLLDIFKMKKAAKKIHRQYNLNMVHTRPGVPALVGLWMKKTMGIKFLNDIREFYADSRVDGGMWNTKLPIFASVYNYFKKKEAEAVAQSDAIVCLTYAAENIIKQWKEYNPTVPLEVIPCSADMELFNPFKIDLNQQKALQLNLQLSNTDIVVSYLGSIGGWYLTDEMMQFCKIFIDKLATVKLLFISPHRHDEIKSLAKKYGIDEHKIIIQKVSRQQVPLLLSLSSYSIFFIKPCYSKLSSSPTKHGEIMAMGIPLITNSGVGDVEEIVVKYKSGFIVKSFSPTEFEDIADQISKNTAFDKEGIRQGAMEFYSLENAIQKYINIYNSILQQ